MLSAVKTAGAFITVGITLGVLGWIVHYIFPPLTFLIWLFGVSIALLAIPFGALVWLSNRKRSDES